MKVLLTATVQSHICQFHKPLVEVLHEHDVEVHVAARDNLAEKNGLKLDFVEKVFDVPFSRSPKSTDNIKAYKQLKKIINEGQYDVIHCNTPMGGIVTRLAARKARKCGTRVYYTAHGFHFYKGAPKKNWIVFYPIEKCMAHLTDTLVTITKEDYQLAKKKFKTEVKHIHGVGVNEDKYLSIDDETNEVFRKENSYNNRFVILCTGELNANKNQITVIKAVEKLAKKYPQILLLLAGNGPKNEELRDAIAEMRLQENVQMLGYRTDLEKYVNASDLVVSASFREGMPLNIMEAMICKKPVVASNNRGHRELVENGVTGYIVAPVDVEGFVREIERFLKDREFLQKMSDDLRGKAYRYMTKNVKEELKDIYGLRNE